MARPRKVSDEQLQEILTKYITDTPYITAIKYADLAKFANEELGCTDVTYQDFSRHKAMKEIIATYNEQNRLSTYIRKNNDKVVKLEFNVDALVDKYKNNPKQLKVVLRAYKNGYDRGFEELANYAKTDKENQEIIKQQEQVIKDLNQKNKELRVQLKEEKEKNKNSHKVDRIKWMYLLLKDMINQNNCYIESEEEVVDILKNFGYKSSDTLDVESIIKSEFDIKDVDEIVEKNIHAVEEKIITKEKSVAINQQDNIIQINNKQKLELPDFMKSKYK